MREKKTTVQWRVLLVWSSPIKNHLAAPFATTKFFLERLIKQVRHILFGKTWSKENTQVIPSWFVWTSCCSWGDAPTHTALRVLGEPDTSSKTPIDSWISPKGSYGLEAARSIYRGIVSRCLSNPKFGVTKNRHLESSTSFVSARIKLCLPTHVYHRIPIAIWAMKKKPVTFHYG